MPPIYSQDERQSSNFASAQLLRPNRESLGAHTFSQKILTAETGITIRVSFQVPLH